MMRSVLLLASLWISSALNGEQSPQNDQSHSDISIDFAPVYATCDPTPNSDIHRNNGLYYIKPDANGPVIAAICSNGYTMIDPTFDLRLERLPSYLSSWDYSRMSLDMIMPNLDDTATFREWWLPSDEATKFRIADQCRACESSKATTPENADDVVYYTDSYNFCYTTFRDGNPCEQHINDEACNKCDDGIFADDSNAHSYWSRCNALQVSPDTPSLHPPDGRVNNPLLYRPAMSLTRHTCTCYQTSATEPPVRYMVPAAHLPLVTLAKQVAANDVRFTVDYISPLIQFDYDDNEDKQAALHPTDCSHNIHYLSQSDFLHGTYRIRECGEYILTQDIAVNFNAPSAAEESASDFSPNRITGDRLYWFPTAQQAEQEYGGLYNYTGAYSLGFFAAITVECDQVVINLNGFTLAMDRRFYVQQRFFSLIELAAKPFLPWQGASTWGLTGVYYASNVEIKGPGVIGRSSHHGIHGNLNTHVHIHDLRVRQFDVAGIACNGCSYVTIEDVVVGPQNKDIPTLGRYTHARAFIPRLMDLQRQYGEQEIQFYGRAKTTVSALCARMVQQMDMIYFNYIEGREYDEADGEWIAAQKVFKNPTGWMDGGSSYGVVINGGGAAVVGIGTRINGCNNIRVNNLEIFGVYNQAQEKIKFTVPEGTSRGILFDVTDWISVTDQIEDRSRSQYVGDVFTDIQFAVNRFVTSWYYRNSLYIGPEEEEYVFRGNLPENNYPFLTIFPAATEDRSDDAHMSGCGTDIQLHSSKGAIGLMVNGAQDSVFNNIYIHEVYNWADLGLDVCGEYDGPHLTTEDIDIQYGYTGTRAHGMVIDWTTGQYKDIQIEDVESWHGEANGLTIYKESYIDLQSLLIRNINAGTRLDAAKVDTLTLPNLVPRACAVDIHDRTVINYGESYIDLQSLLIRNINAGTRLDAAKVDTLTLPNLVPRACAVDIHDRTVINYVSGGEVDNIVFNNVVGFDTCDQFGPPMTNYMAKREYAKKQVIDLQLTNIICLVVVCVMIVCIFYALYRSIMCIKHANVMNMVAMSENTPLLKGI
eukprot:CAMPEP_0202729440 /NCGR_PEP_ID=MMETSP1385-20130828/186133_1 /ASSEMBLY_ACC=CAM_ASM_000861 /TAXON_ID=933848 /ORGANISM="Elphidium margaritaceum" /LENGTH=1043 /DNA_ID=CAMNT_0049395701 /DNA_START=32 /DNA_END=3164 /DNA_ORIENTATION=-